MVSTTLFPRVWDPSKLGRLQGLPKLLAGTPNEAFFSDATCV
jgi:hypothetical protein